MATSTDAVLAFGFDIGDELPEVWEQYGEASDVRYFVFEDWYADQLLPDLKAPDHDDYKKDWPEYWAARRRAVEAAPIEMIEHCSGEYPMYFLALNHTKTRASRGTPEVIETFEPPVEKIGALIAFCEQYGIEYNEAKWHIFSMWN